MDRIFQLPLQPARPTSTLQRLEYGPLQACCRITGSFIDGKARWMVCELFGRKRGAGLAAYEGLASPSLSISAFSRTKVSWANLL